MSDWERDANAALHALGEAWQQGGISRETYRERRRRIIAALRDRGDETERRAVSPPAVAGDTGAAAEGATMMLGLRRGSPSSWRWLAVLAAASAVVATAVWMVWTMEQGNV